MVFGDIGTSPIYTVQTVFNPGDPHPISATSDNIFGIISLIFWSVTIIVTVTYVLLVTRADNDGEGGIMALITLIRRLAMTGGRRTKLALAALGIFGGLVVPRGQHDHAGHLRALGRGGARRRAAVAGPTWSSRSRRPSS